MTRARMRSDNTIEHIETPEYHGDPLDPQGCLCFYHFGWELIGDLKTAGFAKAAGYVFCPRFVLLGRGPTFSPFHRPEVTFDLSESGHERLDSVPLEFFANRFRDIERPTGSWRDSPHSIPKVRGFPQRADVLSGTGNPKALDQPRNSRVVLFLLIMGRCDSWHVSFGCSSRRRRRDTPFKSRLTLAGNLGNCVATLHSQSSGIPIALNGRYNSGLF